jgi:hypothetical protein
MLNEGGRSEFSAAVLLFLGGWGGMIIAWHGVWGKEGIRWDTYHGVSTHGEGIE